MFLIGLTIIAIVSPLVASYDESLDKLNVDKILGDDALFDEYIECFLDKGPCKAEHSAELKKIIPEVVAEACSKCTSIQKVNTRKLVTALYTRRPNKAIEFHKKFDPAGKYEAKFAAFLIA